MERSDSFKLLWEEEIPEISSRAKLFQHKKTEAEVLVFENSDENKVFGVSFATLPDDSTGVAHIMEHSVLCGSEKYPVKDPFLQLKNSSLYTFLNAFTFPDKTVYPVASRNEQDLYNLMDVYLDTVFKPRITPEILNQEGWHYEFKEDSDVPTLSGVVFNEMKGAFSNPDQILGRLIINSLNPDNSYRHESGGDPRDIPNLTYEQFIAFYKKHYAPSLAKFCFYGNGDTEKHLEHLAAYLDDLTPDSAEEIKWQMQEKWAKPREVTAYFAGAKDQNNTVCLAWQLGGNLSASELLALEILDYALLGSEAGPLKLALLESGLGTDLAGFRLDPEVLQPNFSIGLKGVKPEDKDKVVSLIQATLKTLAEKGLDENLKLGAINTMEFDRRENTGGSMPSGIDSMRRALNSWLYGGHPLTHVRFEKEIAQVRSELNSGILENLIKEHLLENTHMLTIELSPDPEMMERLSREEAEKIAKISSTWDKAKIAEEKEREKHLKAWQQKPDSPEDLAKIPVLSLKDIPVDGEDLMVEPEEIDGTKVFRHNYDTNGITYLDLMFDIQHLDVEELRWVEILSDLLFRLDAEDKPQKDWNTEVDIYTGGIGLSSYFISNLSDFSVQRKLHLATKFLPQNEDKVPELIERLLTKIKISDPEKLHSIMKEGFTGMQDSFSEGGTTYAFTRAQAPFRPAAALSEAINGIDYFFWLKEKLGNFDTHKDEYMSLLSDLYAKLFSSQNMISVVTAQDADKLDIGKFVHFLSTKSYSPVTLDLKFQEASEAFTLPVEVGFMGQVWDLGESVLHGSDFIANKLIDSELGWNEVRVKGGAYGGGSLLRLKSRIAGFYSYRDPKVEFSLDTYKSAAYFLQNFELSEARLEKSIISVIGDLDPYMLPREKAMTALHWYLEGWNDALEQRLREEVLGTTEILVREYADKLKASKQKKTVVLAADSQVPKWMDKKKLV